MIYDVLAKICQVLEIVAEKGLFRALRDIFYWRGELVPVERDLATVQPFDAELSKLEATFVRLSPDNRQEDHIRYPVLSRKYKAKRYLARGYCAFVLTRNNEALGEIWHGRMGATKAELAHRDFNALGIEPGEKDVYLFDMFVDPRRRGQSLATPLMGGALNALGHEGCAKGYGFFRADNIPALWVHRTLKYKELPRVSVRRILGFTRVLPTKPKT